MFIPAPTSGISKKRSSLDKPKERSSQHHHSVSQPTGATTTTTSALESSPDAQGAAQQQPPLNTGMLSSAGSGAYAPPEASGGNTAVPFGAPSGTESVRVPSPSTRQLGQSQVTRTTVAPPLIVDGSALTAGTVPTSNSSRALRPWFCLAASDATIVAMEHSMHFGFTAFALSSGEVCVGRHGNGGAFEGPPPRVEQIGKMPGPCTQLVWGPWTGGAMIACCCPGRCVKVFSLLEDSAVGEVDGSAWAEELVEVSECTAVAVAWIAALQETVLLCAAARWRLVYCRRGDESFGAWTDTVTYNVLTGSGSTAGEAGECVTSASTTGAAAAGLTAGGTAAGARATSKKAPSSGKDLISVAAVTGIETQNTVTVAVGDQDGGVRLLELSVPDASSKKPPTLTPTLLLTSGSFGSGGVAAADATSPASPSSPSAASGGAVKYLAWAPANGRSFWMLAFATATDICVALLAKPLYFVMENMPAQPTKLLGMRRVRMVDADVLKVSWNSVGTRITTSHADGTVRLFTVEVNYRESRFRALAAEHRGGASVPSSDLAETFRVDIAEVARATAPCAHEASQAPSSDALM